MSEEKLESVLPGADTSSGPADGHEETENLQPPKEEDSLTPKASVVSRPESATIASPYSFLLEVTDKNTPIAHEEWDTPTHFLIALELSGVPSLKEISVECNQTLHGYEIKVVANKPSAFGAAIPVPKKDSPPEPGLPPGAVIVPAGYCSVRELGEVSWTAHLTGVFDGKHEMNYSVGVLKLRFKKRIATTDVLKPCEF